jgi:hypothetical protein
MAPTGLRYVAGGATAVERQIEPMCGMPNKKKSALKEIQFSDAKNRIIRAKRNRQL